MQILYAILITLIVYPITGTLFFASVEKISASVKLKALIITMGHPLATAILLWLVCSIFSLPIAEFSVLLVCGSLLRIPFSNVKYLIRLTEASGTTSIEYFSESIQKRTIQLNTADIKNISQSDGRRLVDKPSSLIVSLAKQTLKFKILDQQAMQR